MELRQTAQAVITLANLREPREVRDVCMGEGTTSLAVRGMRPLEQPATLCGTAAALSVQAAGNTPKL